MYIVVPIFALYTRSSRQVARMKAKSRTEKSWVGRSSIYQTLNKALSSHSITQSNQLDKIKRAFERRGLSAGAEGFAGGLLPFTNDRYVSTQVVFCVKKTS